MGASRSEEGAPFFVLSMSRSYFSIPILAVLCTAAALAKEFARQEPAAEIPDTVAASFKPLDHYQALWSRSLFTTHEVKVEASVVEDASWAATLQLSGWSEVDGQLSVYLFRSDTEQTFILNNGEPAQSGVMQLVAVENTETILDARVRVRLNGQEAWIRQVDESGATTPPVSGAAQSGGVQVPTTVDSRASRLTSPVVLTNNTTFEGSLSPSADPANSAAQTPVARSDAQPASPEVIQRLRERHEHLYRMFPRPPGP